MDGCLKGQPGKTSLDAAFSGSEIGRPGRRFGSIYINILKNDAKYAYRFHEGTIHAGLGKSAVSYFGDRCGVPV